MKEFARCLLVLVAGLTGAALFFTWLSAYEASLQFRVAIRAPHFAL